MKKLQEVFDPLTILSVSLALFIVAAALTTRAVLEKNSSSESTPSLVVTEFLDTFVPSRATVDQQRLVEQYFTNAGSTELDHDGAGETLRRLLSVFNLSEDNPVSYRICTSQSDYIEVMLMDTDGSDLPCRIGMLYRTTNEKISSFSLFRLLPVDKTNPEWTQRWL